MATPKTQIEQKLERIEKALLAAAQKKDPVEVEAILNGTEENLKGTEPTKSE
jgi:hypothetical protein